MGQFLQPDFSKGDPNTLGGYMAVHDRPAAFEGSDGFSYTADILVTDESEPGGARECWGAYLLFVKWARLGASAPEGHLESDILARGATEAEAIQHVGRLPLNDVKRLLDTLIERAHGGVPKRKWWDAMNGDEGEGHHA